MNRSPILQVPGKTNLQAVDLAKGFLDSVKVQKGLGGVLIGQRRFAVVGLVTALLTIVIWTGYDADNGLIEGSVALTQGISGHNLDGYYLDGVAGSADPTESFVISGISLIDETSLRTPPNYVMPTVPAEQVNAQLIF